MIVNPADHPKQGPMHPLVGCDEAGVRVYYQPGDPPWRYRWDCLRWEIANGRSEWTPADEPIGCEACGAVAPLNDYDCLGADSDKVFCPDCGAEVEGVEMWESQLSHTPDKTQKTLFGATP
jgi:hypothetical protein